MQHSSDKGCMVCKFSLNEAAIFFTSTDACSLLAIFKLQTKCVNNNLIETLMIKNKTITSWRKWRLKNEKTHITTKPWWKKSKNLLAACNLFSLASYLHIKENIILRYKNLPATSLSPIMTWVNSFLSMFIKEKRKKKSSLQMNQAISHLSNSCSLVKLNNSFFPFI